MQIVERNSRLLATLNLVVPKLMGQVVKSILNSSYFVWAILALPALWNGSLLLFQVLSRRRVYYIRPASFAARFMIIAMALTPMRILFPKARWLFWLIQRRRYFGVAAFGYAALHTLLYIFDMGALQPILDEFWALGIWTGWGAFLIFLPLAATSIDISQRWLLSGWKTLQRLVYPASGFDTGSLDICAQQFRPCVWSTSCRWPFLKSFVSGK